MADDEKKTFAYQTPAAWELHGPARSFELDRAVMLAVEIGIAAEPIAAGRYRLTASHVSLLSKLAEYLTANERRTVGLRVEEPADGLRISYKLRPDREPVRSAYVHGTDQIERPVARAIDAGLQARCVGVKRFHITGPSRQHVAWVQDLFEVSRERALQIMGATEEQIAREDAPAPLPEINVHLPARQTVSEIERDYRGEITRVTATERTAEA